MHRLCAFVNIRKKPGRQVQGGPGVPRRPGAPLSFDVTAALKPGADNQVTLTSTRAFINELGTGGLLGPGYLYREN